MRIGSPKEIKNHEYRVGLTPESAKELVMQGHDVWIETQAGSGIDASDEQYVAAGAKIVDGPDAIFAECEMEGDELAVMLSKPLLRMLTKGGVPEPKVVAEAILKQRDAALSKGKKEAAPTECSFCFEVYRDDGDGCNGPVWF